MASSVQPGFSSHHLLTVTILIEQSSYTGITCFYNMAFDPFSLEYS